MNHKPILANAFIQALHDAGAFVDEPETVSRVIIDAQAGSILKVHVCRFGDERLLAVVASGGIEIVETRGDDGNGQEPASA